jgi:hypothetical protein
MPNKTFAEKRHLFLSISVVVSGFFGLKDTKKYEKAIILVENY